MIVVRGRAPRGFRDLAAYALGYGAQATGYLLLLTPRYPSSDPKLAEEYSELPEHPVRIDVEGGLEHSRLTVFFRLLLTIPHFIWLLLWGIVVWFAVVIAWFVALVTGRVPDALHRFIAAYIRYATHVFAFVHLVGRRFPGFTGTGGLVRDRPRHRARCPAEPVEDPLPALPRHPGVHRGQHARRSPLHPRLPRLVVRARDRAHAGRAPQPRRIVPPLRGADVRVRHARHRPLPVRGARPPREAGARASSPSTRPFHPPPGGSALKVAIAVVVAAILVVGAFLLYPTDVPDDLTLPPVDVDAVFGAAFVARAERFERFHYVLWVLSQIALLAVLVVYARRGIRFVRESAAGPIGTGMLLGMLGIAIAWLVRIPFRAIGALVGPAVRPDRPRLPRLARSRTGPCWRGDSCRSASRS